MTLGYLSKKVAGLQVIQPSKEATCMFQAAEMYWWATYANWNQNELARALDAGHHVA